MNRDLIPCENCGTLTHIDMLDAKPSYLSGPGWPFLSWLRMWLLNRAAYRGTDFDRLECKRCYGPGYIENCTCPKCCTRNPQPSSMSDETPTEQFQKVLSQLEISDDDCHWYLGDRAQFWKAKYHRRTLEAYLSVGDHTWRSIVDKRGITTDDGMYDFPSLEAAKRAAEVQAIRLAEVELKAAKSTILFYL